MPPQGIAVHPCPRRFDSTDRPDPVARPAKMLRVSLSRWQGRTGEQLQNSRIQACSGRDWDAEINRQDARDARAEMREMRLGSSIHLTLRHLSVSSLGDPGALAVQSNQESW